MNIIERTPKERAIHQAGVSGFPPRHLALMNDGRPMTPSQRKAINQIAPMIKVGGVIVISGNYGTGKTALASWLGYEWNLRGYSRGSGKCLYWTVHDLLRSQKSWFKDQNKPEPFEKARECGLLIVDELDSTNDSIFDQRELRQLIDWRYNRIKPTLFMTNLPPDQIAGAMDASTLDRVMDGGGLIEIKGESMRGV